MMDSAVSIPLSIFRKLLYVIAIISPLVFVLLPFSIISYINFYNVLIPNSFTSSPVKFNQALGGISTSIDFINTRVSFDDSINYIIQLDLSVVCDKAMNDVAPITYRIEEFNIKDTFILNCENRYIYGKNNWFVPYNLRLWVPPLLTKLEKVNKVNVNLLIASGKDLNKLKSFNLKLDNYLIIDDRLSNINTIVQWDGFRYYMVHYYVSCFVIGVGLFWSISSLVCLITSFIIWIKYSSPKKIKFD